WGNGPDVLRVVRRPENIARVLDERGLPCPALHAPDATTPCSDHWLRKPRRGAGGRHVGAWNGDAADPKRWYVQEYVEGESCAAVFVGDGRRALFFGATRQLVGEPWLHARPFQYCGSIGPLPCSAELQRAL